MFPFLVFVFLFEVVKGLFNRFKGNKIEVAENMEIEEKDELNKEQDDKLNKNREKLN